VIELVTMLGWTMCALVLALVLRPAIVWAGGLVEWEGSDGRRLTAEVPTSVLLGGTAAALVFGAYAFSSVVAILAGQGAIVTPAADEGGGEGVALYTLDPCDSEDSTALWNISGIAQVSSPLDTTIYRVRATIDSTIDPVPWNGGCTRAFRTNLDTTSGDGGYGFEWTYGSSVDTTRFVYIRYQMRLSDSLMVGSDWKSTRNHTNTVTASNRNMRTSFGEAAMSAANLVAGNWTDSLDAGRLYTSFNGDCTLCSGLYEEAGEAPPKGFGLATNNGHIQADKPDLHAIALTGDWVVVCTLDSLPDTNNGEMARRIYIADSLWNDTHADPSNIPTRRDVDTLFTHFEKIVFWQNGELLWGDPSDRTLVQLAEDANVFLELGIVEVFNVKPATGCG